MTSVMGAVPDRLGVKATTLKAKAKAKDLASKAKAKDLVFEAKAKAKDLTFKAKAKAKDMTSCPRGASRPRPWPRGLHLWFLIPKPQL